MTLDQVDRYIIFVFGLWFIAKAILFTTTWLVSRKLMQGNVRTRLSAAQHLLFLGLAIVGSAMGPAFLLSYYSGTGLMAADPRIEPYWITVVIRILLMIGLAIVTVAGARSFVAQYKRYHGIEDDPNDAALEQTNVRQDVREGEQNRRENRQVTAALRLTGREELLDDGQVQPIVVDAAVADTIEHTAADVSEMKGDVKTLREHADAADVRADAADVRANAAEARADAAEIDGNTP